MAFKIKMLSRNPEDYVRETKRDIHKLPRNYDPSLHPFEAEREYVRALNATKLERVFAKPFITALSGHKEGVSVLAKHPNALSSLISGSYDGEVRIWNVPRKTTVCNVQAHAGHVRGLCVNNTGNHLISVGDDKAIKRWDLSGLTAGEVVAEPISTIFASEVMQSVSHSRAHDMFATSGDLVHVWNAGSTEPLHSYKWGEVSLHCVRFNPIEPYILGATASDRSVFLYDTRGKAPLKRLVLKLRSNKLTWNPQEAFSFALANEDYNAYTFDMRYLDTPQIVHMDHTAAVMDVDFSPTGKELCTAGYDKCLRIFAADHGRSREVYYTKRMQRVMCVAWTLDDKYIFSGSDEMNIRMWKARAAEKLGKLRPRERAALQYNEKLKEKFSSNPQVKRIARHRHIPRQLYSARREIEIIRASIKRKEQNRRRHGDKTVGERQTERQKHVLQVDD